MTEYKLKVPFATLEYIRAGEFRFGRPYFVVEYSGCLCVSEESNGKWLNQITYDAFVGNSAPCCPLGVTLETSYFGPSYQVTKCSAHQ